MAQALPPSLLGFSKKDLYWECLLTAPSTEFAVKKRKFATAELTNPDAGFQNIISLSTLLHYLGCMLSNSNYMLVHVEFFFQIVMLIGISEKMNKYQVSEFLLVAVKISFVFFAKKSILYAKNCWPLPWA